MSIEAMKQALEALGPNAPECCGCRAEWEIAITALRQAIEQAEKQEPVATLWQHGETGRTRITMPGDITDCDARWFKAADLYTTPQPQREQVVYQLSPTDIYDFAGWLTTRKGLMQVGGAYEAGPMAEAVGEYLKTFPERFATSQREWVGLTDEEIQAVLDKPEPFYDTMFWFARAIEQALKEKNT